jgi:hypothetical protein
MPAALQNALAYAREDLIDLERDKAPVEGLVGLTEDVEALEAKYPPLVRAVADEEDTAGRPPRARRTLAAIEDMDVGEDVDTSDVADLRRAARDEDPDAYFDREEDPAARQGFVRSLLRRITGQPAPARPLAGGASPARSTPCCRALRQSRQSSSSRRQASSRAWTTRLSLTGI